VHQSAHLCKCRVLITHSPIYLFTSLPPNPFRRPQTHTHTQPPTCQLQMMPSIVNFPRWKWFETRDFAHNWWCGLFLSGGISCRLSLSNSCWPWPSLFARKKLNYLEIRYITEDFPKPLLKKNPFVCQLVLNNHLPFQGKKTS